MVKKVPKLNYGPPRNNNNTIELCKKSSYINRLVKPCTLRLV